MMFYVARYKRAGFTLIEIMIVIAIIAILAGIAIPNIVQARFEAGVTACQENCKVGMQAIQAALVRHSLPELADFLQDGVYHHGECWGNLDGLIYPGYLATPLKCPVNGTSVYEFDFFNYNGGYRFYRDFSRIEKLKPEGHCCVVFDYYEHGPEMLPCYEQSLGACLYAS